MKPNDYLDLLESMTDTLEAASTNDNPAPAELDRRETMIKRMRQAVADGRQEVANAQG